MSTLDVRPIDPDTEETWDAFVLGAPGGKIFHMSGWGRSVAQTYGYEAVNLAAFEGGEVVGVLPMVDVRAPLMGRSLVSSAFSVGGGIVTARPDVAVALAKAAEREGRARKVSYVELRAELPTQIPHWSEKSGLYANFSCTIPSNEDENLKMIPRKRRAEVRKAIKRVDAAELRVQENQDTDEFYALYARALRDLGTPIYPRKFIQNLAKNLAPYKCVHTVYDQETALASVFSFVYKDEIAPYYIGTLPQAKRVQAHDLIYWHLMREGAARGKSVFNFGRSKVDSGPFAYKKLWGIEPTMLNYQFCLITQQSLPDVNPNNPKFKLMTNIWRRMPLMATNMLGPIVAPNFP